MTSTRNDHVIECKLWSFFVIKIYSMPLDFELTGLELEVNTVADGREDTFVVGDARVHPVNPLRDLFHHSLLLEDVRNFSKNVALDETFS